MPPPATARIHQFSDAQSKVSLRIWVDVLSSESESSSYHVQLSQPPVMLIKARPSDAMLMNSTDHPCPAQ